MPKVDLNRLGQFFARQPDVVFGVVFGSAKTGSIAPGSDLNLGILFDPRPAPERLVDLLTEVADLIGFDAIDYADLSTANPVLAFEAISGCFLCKNDRGKTAAYCSLVSREYEDVMVQLRRVA